MDDMVFLNYSSSGIYENNTITPGYNHTTPMGDIISQINGVPPKAIEKIKSAILGEPHRDL